jgi:Fe-S-cluster containining protein
MLARESRISTGDAVVRYTMRRGSLLKFEADGGCTALDGVRCSIHRGRPLACRLYPLGLERNGGRERFNRLESAVGSTGLWGNDGIAGFLTAQDVQQHLALNERYRPLIRVLHEQVMGLSDFEIVEPREFWRRAVAEAVRETQFDANRIIDAIFDADGIGCARDSIAETVAAHLSALFGIAERETDPSVIAAAAVLLAVSLGYPPAEAIGRAGG